MSGYEIGLFVGGFILGSGVEVGVAFGREFPCIGQIARGVESAYYLGYYTYSLLANEDPVVYTAITVYMYELYGVMSLNMCAKGFLFSPQAQTAKDLYTDSASHTANAAVEAVQLGLDIYELLWIMAE